MVTIKESVCALNVLHGMCYVCVLLLALALIGTDLSRCKAQAADQV